MNVQIISSYERKIEFWKSMWWSALSPRSAGKLLSKIASELSGEIIEKFDL